MPKSVFCLYGGDRLGIAEALELRRRSSSERRPRFSCEGCGQPVRAHKRGTTGQAAHFEHIAKNPSCRFSGR